LKSKSGIEYAASTKTGSGQVFGGNLGPTLNPGMPVRHRIVFDVPDGIYDLVVSQGINPGGQFIVKRRDDIFKWILTPAARQ
jgi:hypothetical protein